MLSHGDVEERFDHLLLEFPFPTGWAAKPELFVSEFPLGSLVFVALGISLTHSKGQESLGSAVGLLKDWVLTLERAFFELHERIAVIQAREETKDGNSYLAMQWGVENRNLK